MSNREIVSIGRNKATLKINGKTYSTEVYSDYDEGVCHHNHNLRTCFMCNDIKDLKPDEQPKEQKPSEYISNDEQENYRSNRFF